MNKYIQNLKTDGIVISQINNVLQTQTKNIYNIEFYEKITNKKAIAYNYVTEGNFLNKDNLIILGPGPLTAQEVDENISIKSYEDTIKIYSEIIKKYCE